MEHPSPLLIALDEGRGTLPGGCKVSLHLSALDPTEVPLCKVMSRGAYQYIFYVNYHVAQEVAAIGKYFIAVPFPPTHKVKIKMKMYKDKTTTSKSHLIH